jgi:hypothetical protein
VIPNVTKWKQKLTNAATITKFANAKIRLNAGKKDQRTFLVTILHRSCWTASTLVTHLMTRLALNVFNGDMTSLKSNTSPANVSRAR